MRISMTTPLRTLMVSRWFLPPVRQVVEFYLTHIVELNCRKLGVLTTDLSGIPKWQFEKKVGRNYEERYHIEFSIIFTFYSAHFDVKFEYKGM
jgi:hypothetical protein